jgi:hypothetical protein
MPFRSSPSRSRASETGEDRVQVLQRNPGRLNAGIIIIIITTGELLRHLTLDPTRRYQLQPKT